MFDVATITVLVGLVSVVATVASTLWHRRLKGPEATSQIVTASTLFLKQLQDRIEVLEERIGHLELENRQYYRLYGPLPPPVPITQTGED